LLKVSQPCLALGAAGQEGFERALHNRWCGPSEPRDVASASVCLNWAVKHSDGRRLAEAGKVVRAGSRSSADHFAAFRFGDVPPRGLRGLRDSCGTARQGRYAPPAPAAPGGKGPIRRPGFSLLSAGIWHGRA
jgi:hypothetical protein